MAFGKLAFGGEEFRYDTLPGLGSRFAIGDRGIADLVSVTVDSTVGDTRNAGTPAPAAAVQETAAAESKTEALVAPPISTTSSATVEEQFISLPESPKASSTLASPDGPKALSRAEAGAEPGQELPWNQASVNIRSPLLRLHTEIVEFCRFLEPTAQEAAMREAATQRVRQSIVEVYPSASVQVFGSFVTGLYLPTSDIDLVVMDSGADDIKIALRALSNKLSNTGIAIKIQV
ncbi:hypothetical protein MMC08_008045 [Hypocenomyce scalaris]|nr:hypothetical protein [Hypocenomyce scalaris]